MPENNIEQQIQLQQIPSSPTATKFIAQKTKVTTKKVNVTKTKTKKTRLKTTGEAGAIALSNVSVGKKNTGKKTSIYKQGDSIDDVAVATADLIAGSSRQLFKLAEKSENERLNAYLAKKYVPKSEREALISEEDLVRRRLNLI